MALLGIFMAALVVRILTGYFIGTHLDDAGWFPFGIYKIFHTQAAAIIDGTASWFWLDPSQTAAAIYPPGYSIWLALIYAISGDRSTHTVQVVQLVLDAASVLLIAEIGVSAFNRAVGIAAGWLAALSPLLALYGSAPLADAPTSWIVLAGVWMLIRALRSENTWWALGAGAMIGLSCWFRANGLMLGVGIAVVAAFCVAAAWQKRLIITAAVLAGAVILVSPVVIRNSITFGAFVPTGLGLGTNLWEGIGETERAAEFGAVYGDRVLLEKERAELGLPDGEHVTLYWPDGVARDRARTQKALDVITSHPVWYAGVMAARIWHLIKYAGDDAGIYGSTGVNITPSKCLPPEWRVVPLTTAVTVIGWLQSALRWILLPMMALGICLGLRSNWRFAAVLLAVIAYYLIAGSFLHTEIRYSLPAQALLIVFAGQGVDWLISKVRPEPDRERRT